ncbi:MAG: serine/threonine protein kinase [Kiritimatiellae bacterium]|nr:serine/threonine protein kinase [Kiritimatiellia bacterium]
MAANDTKTTGNGAGAGTEATRRRIGPYELVRLLGKGGMSEVYEAENTRLGSRHALKLYAYEKDDPEVRERFLVEGRLLARLSHPRIVKVTDFGTDEASGRPYFVMDLVLNGRGEMQLLSDVQPGTADEETIGRWYDDLRDGLAYIHANGVIHRDLKLQNVLIGPDGHAVLTDFGISKIFDAKGDGVQIVDTVRTLVKMREGRSLVMGSLGYMAPELEMGVAASPQSDWYALGVIVYRMLTGTWCDARTDVVSTLETYDPVWRRIIPKLLHSNPNGRECLSYADEKRADREKAEFEAEERWLREKSRGHRARHIARYVALALAVALLLGAFLWRGNSASQRIFQANLQDAVELVDAAIGKITLARSEEEFEAFGGEIGDGISDGKPDSRKKDDIFGEFSSSSRSMSVLDSVKVLLERSSDKLHGLLRKSK